MKRVLIVEDGFEYTEAFTRLLPKDAAADVAFTRAGDLAEAREEIAKGAPDAVFLDVVFDRTPEDRLAGDLDPLIARFGGDRARAVTQLAENQGFYVLDALAPLLPPGLSVVIAYDFTSEPQRFDALRKRIPGLSGLPDGISISRALNLLGVS